MSNGLRTITVNLKELTEELRSELTAVQLGLKPLFDRLERAGDETSSIVEAFRTAGGLVRALLGQGVERDKAIDYATALIATWRSAGDPISGWAPSIGAAWAESGFPTVEVSHKLAASFACTAIPKQVAADVVLPWRCFLLRTPGVEPTHQFMLHSHTGLFQSFCFGILDESRRFGSKDVIVAGFEHSLAAYADVSFEEKAETDLADFAEWRAKLAGRMLICACLELDGVDRKEGAEYIRVEGGGNKTGSGQVYKCIRPVRVDLRDHIQKVLSNPSGSSKLNLRHVVRGHHKRQPFGPGRNDRKWIHVEPYWRGDPDSPIAVRRHLLGVEESK